MVNSVLSHSYLKPSCLQVFLYTCIDKLIDEASDVLIRSTHDDMVYAIVPSYDLKRSLEKVLLEKKGACGFTAIGTDEEIIQTLLDKKFGFHSYQIYTQRLLQLSLYSLLVKNPDSEFLLKLKSSAKDKTRLFDLAYDLAQDILDFFQSSYKAIDPQISDMLDQLKAAFPARVFVDQALDLVKEKLDHTLWIGFDTLSSKKIDLLKQTSAIIFNLVPSFAYLGDVLTPKQRLKLLKGYSGKREQVVEKEHPLLSGFSKDYNDYYHLIIDYCHVDILDLESQAEDSSLIRLQKSLQEGIIEEIGKSDETIQITSEINPYKECQALISYLQAIFELNPRISTKDILVLTDNHKLYGPILNSMGASLSSSICFQYEESYDPLFALFEFLFLENIKNLGQNELSRCLLLMMKIVENSSHFKVLNEMNWLVQNMSFGLFYNQGLKAQNGVDLLKRLKNVFLKSAVFDYDTHEIPYELNFLDIQKIEDFDDLYKVLNDFIIMIESVSLVCEQEKQIKDWVIFCLELFEKLEVFIKIPFFIRKALIHSLSEFDFIDEDLTMQSFYQLIKQLIPRKINSFHGIELKSPRDFPDKKYEVVALLGQNNKSVSSSGLILSNIPKSKKDHFDSLWFNQSSKFIYYSYLQNYSENFLSDPSKWIKSLTETLHLIKLSTCYKHVSMGSSQVQDFLHDSQDAVFIPNLENQNAVYLEADYLNRYIKDPEGVIKKTALKVKSQEHVLDVEVASLNLLSWKFANYLHPNHDLASLANLKNLYKATTLIEKSADLFRTRFVKDDDELTNMKIKEALQILTNEGVQLQITGKINLSQEQKIEKFLLRKTLIRLI